MKYSAWFNGIVLQPSTPGSPQRSLRSMSVSRTVSGPANRTVGHGASPAAASDAHRSRNAAAARLFPGAVRPPRLAAPARGDPKEQRERSEDQHQAGDRKSTRLNSSHLVI